MSVQTGIYRLAQVIKWAGLLIAGVLGLGGVGWIVGMGGKPSNMGMATLFLVLAAIVFGIARGVAWILEGFARE